MSHNEEVMERKVIHAGNVFIKAGEDHPRAYVVQKGLVRSFIMQDDIRIDVGEYEPGRIIGETCLMIDEPMELNYEAVEDTTVITITRQTFQKKLARMDKEVSSIFDHVMKKINTYDQNSIEKAVARAEIDDDAYKMVHAITAGLDQHKSYQYEKAILPHVNAMIKAIRQVKESFRANDMPDSFEVPGDDLSENQDDMHLSKTNEDEGELDASSSSQQSEEEEGNIQDNTEENNEDQDVLGA